MPVSTKPPIATTRIVDEILEAYRRNIAIFTQLGD